MGKFVTLYFIKDRWYVTSHYKTKKEAVEEVSTPPRLAKATQGRVVRRKDGIVVHEVTYS